MRTAGLKLYQFGRRASRTRLIKHLIPEKLRALVQSRLLPSAINFLPDRQYMESSLLPAIRALGPTLIVDVGVEHYSSHYSQFFAGECEYRTIDRNPGVAQYGSPDGHIIGDVRNLERYFGPHSVDVLLMNGVFGYGVDLQQDQEQVIEAASVVLRSGGWLLVGWDRAPDGRPLAVSRRSEYAPLQDPLKLAVVESAFVHVGPLDMPARAELADCSHVYDWFERR